jgi:hypothetical protein
MSARFIAAVAFYGTKGGAFKQRLKAIQEMCRDGIGKCFEPYTLEQIHSTVVRLDGSIHFQSRLLVNQHYLQLAGVPREMDLARALGILTSEFKVPLKIVIGGFTPDNPGTFMSRGQRSYERMFSAQDGALVLVGWPAVTVENGISVKPLDEIRRKMNEANILHWYHQSRGDIDNDFHLVIGHYSDVSHPQVNEATHAVSAYLAKNPIRLEVGVDQLSVVASDSPTLSPAQFIGRLPLDPAKIRDLYGCFPGPGGRGR